jgi:hypothetical protein
MPAADIDAVAEQLAGQCTVEVAASEEFSGLLAAPEITAAYDHIIFDTNPDGASCLGPLSALGTKRCLYQDTVAALGVTNQRLIINGLLATPLLGDPVAEAFSRQQHDAIAHGLAAAGCPTHLGSTDPAGRLATAQTAT